MKCDKINIYLFLLSFFASFFALAQQPLVLDFEKQSVEGVKRPWGWSVYSYQPGATSSLDSTVKRNGKYSFKISNAEQTLASPFAMGYWVAPQALHGKKIKISGWVKTENHTGTVKIAAESYGNMGTLTTLDSVSKIITGFNTNLPWTRFELITKIGPGALSVYIILGLTGTGNIWFDDISVSVNDKIVQSVSVAPDISAAQLKWLGQYTFPITSVDATRDKEKEELQDLEPFGKIAGDAKIIAVGESSHGTSEFFRMKNRLLEYAVKKLGIRVFSIEANQLACERINDYVCKGIGTPEKLIKTLFAVWNTEEVLDLIKWLRAYHISNPEKQVEFVGIDMQDPFLPMDSLLAFIAKHDPPIHAQVEGLLAEYKAAWKKQYYPTASDSVHAKWKNSAKKVWDIVSERKNNWLERSASDTEKEQVQWAIQNAKVIYQNATLRSYLNNSLNSIFRDSCMAENLKWALDKRGKNVRTLLWAHDAHISRCSAKDPALNYFTGQSMGSFLLKIYGQNYRAFGLSTYVPYQFDAIIFIDKTTHSKLLKAG